MQEFVGQPPGQLGQYVFGVAAVGQQALGLLQFFVAQALALLAIGLEHVHRGQLAQAQHEVFGPHRHQLFGSLGRALAALEVFRHHVVQVIDSVQVDVVQFADFGFDIARYGNVDHENRLVPALFQRALDRTLAEDRQLAGGGADDDVAVGQFLGDVGQQNGVRTELLGQDAGPLKGTVGHDDAAHALLMQVAGDQGDGFAGTDQQGLAAAQVAEDLLGQADRGKRHRHRVFADGSVGAHLLGGTESGLEQAPEQWADGASLTRHGVGGLHLAEDLRLAEHQRVQAGGHPHHVLHRLVLFVHVGAGAQLVQAEAVVVGEPLQHDIGGQVVLLDIELATVAGRQNRRFAAGCQSAELLQGVYQLLWGKRHALAYVYRGSLMVDTKCKKGHARSLVVTGSR
ncbi:hypothetical protein D3C79_481020 [compost metagenome]